MEMNNDYGTVDVMHPVLTSFQSFAGSGMRFAIAKCEEGARKKLPNAVEMYI